MHSWFVEPDEHDPLLGDRVLLGLGLRVLWVLGAGPSGRAEARDTRLDAGQVTEVPEDGVVDETHLGRGSTPHARRPAPRCGSSTARTTPPLPPGCSPASRAGRRRLIAPPGRGRTSRGSARSGAGHRRCRPPPVAGGTRGDGLGLGGKLGGAAAEARRAGLVAWRPWSGTFRGPAGLMPLLLPINQFGMTFKSLCVYTYITSRVPCEGVGGTSWAGAWHDHGGHVAVLNYLSFGRLSYLLAPSKKNKSF